MLLQALLLRQKTALLILPYVSLVEEKMEGLELFGTALGFRVDGYYGVSGRFPVPKGPGLLVCTIEKGNSVLNHLAEEGRLNELGTVVIDELHMLGDGPRGVSVEVLVSKLLFACPEVPFVCLLVHSAMPMEPSVCLCSGVCSLSASGVLVVSRVLVGRYLGVVVC